MQINPLSVLRRNIVSRADSMAPDSTQPLNDQARLVASLRNPAVFGTGCARVAMLETHISYVLLTGKFAYKIKKDVNLGFLDFTLLPARRYYCEQELRLNRRHAPSLYLDVVAITGSIDRPALDGNGPPLEYAVRMREFPQESLASRLLAGGRLDAADIDALAAGVAAFHARIDTAPPDTDFGRPEPVLRLALENFERIRPLLERPDDIAALDALARWTGREHAARCADLVARRRAGFIRECHGDLHLGNIARIDGEMTIFDCIEFNEEMRWIDVISEIAFTVMDLEDHGRADLAQRFLNTYLETTGDYGGLRVLRFYVAYRAMVRAMVARLRASQTVAADVRRAAHRQYDGYVAIAQSCALPPRPAIVLTHGLAGSGKTTLSQPLLELLRAVRIRTDVERKREHGFSPLERKRDGLDAGLYAPEATESTYGRVRALARDVVEAGYAVIVDAAFLKRWQRDLFRRLASELDVPFAIVSFSAPESALRERIERRAAAANDASDATLAVLEYQLRTEDVLAPDEQNDTIVYDSTLPLARSREPSAWDAVLERIGARAREPAPR
jgi:aminoglycoside phosphotransferase family enzyme/predicted kinase